MTAANEKACGHGAFADEPCVYTTIEQKVSAVRKFYDEVLKDTNIANPARNVRRVHRNAIDTSREGTIK